MKGRTVRVVIWLALLFIVIEGIASLIYHQDPDLSSLANLGRYTRVIAAGIVLWLCEKKS